jgi:hypothetical protein
MCVCARAQLVAELQKNLEVLDRIYPKLKIDLVMVQGTPTPSTRQCPPVRPARAMSASVGAAGDFSPSLVDQLSLHFQVRAETFASHRTLVPETSPCASFDALSPCASQPVPGDTWRRVACRGGAASVKRSGAGAEELHVHRVPWRPLPVPLPLLRPPARSARACVQTRARPCAAHAHGAARSGSPSLRHARGSTTRPHPITLARVSQ